MLLDLLPLFEEATTTAGGQRHRHMGESGFEPREAQRFVRFRWHLTFVTNGAIGSPASVATPSVSTTVMLGSPVALPRPRLTIAGHLATHSQVAGPSVRVLNLDDEDELLLLDLL